MSTYLDVSVGVEEHDADEGQNLAYDVVVPPGQVRQDLDDGAVVVQRHLHLIDVSQLSVNDRTSQLSVNDRTSQLSVNDRTSQLSVNDRTSQLSVNDRTSQLSVNDRTSQLSDGY